MTRDFVYFKERNESARNKLSNEYFKGKSELILANETKDKAQ